MSQAAAAAPVAVAVRLATAAAPVPQACRLAGRRLLLTHTLPVLRPFTVAASSPSPSSSSPSSPLVASPPPARPPGAVCRFADRAWLGGRWRTAECWEDAAGYYLSIEGGGVFRIEEDGETLSGWPVSDLDPAVLAEILLGPPLMLALAHGGVFCLHASAVARRGVAAAFVGVSGAGKSTLAAALDREGTWRRLADDVLPTRSAAGVVEALPDFPQLKLAPEAQAGVAAGGLRLARIYRLEEAAEIEVERLTARDAAAAALGNTVAARLFGPALLSRHLGHAAEIAERVRVRRLAYPRVAAELPQLVAAVLADLDDG